MKKIVVIGPESTGKSTLCKQLADHYNTDWVPEYAREYLLQRGAGYTYEDLLVIAKGQIALEDEFTSVGTVSPPASVQYKRGSTPEKLLFIDTDMYVMKVWCEFVFNQCHPWILDQVAARHYDFYFLCDIDLPWVQDGLREYPNIASRQKLYRIYKDIMVNQSVPWMEISGNEEQRLQKAIDAVEKLMKR